MIVIELICFLVLLAIVLYIGFWICVSIMVVMGAIDGKIKEHNKNKEEKIKEEIESVKRRKQYLEERACEEKKEQEYRLYLKQQKIRDEESKKAEQNRRNNLTPEEREAEYVHKKNEEIKAKERFDDFQRREASDMREREEKKRLK